MGETWMHKASWADALDAYTKAKEFDDLPIFRVFMAKCHLHLDQVKRAASEIGAVAPSSLNEAEVTDYVFVFAAIAVATGEHGTLEQAASLLKQQELASPLFRSERDALLLSVMEALQHGTSRPLLVKARRALAGLLARANRYLLLEPNIMGLGIRGNAMLGDIAKAVDTHKNMSDSKQSD
jgi:hypothetical protein